MNPQRSPGRVFRRAVLPEKRGDAPKDWWDKFKIMTWFLVSVVTLLWTVLSWSLVQYHEQRAAERQAQTAIESRELQRMASVAQLVPALIPSLTKGTESERRIAFLTLASIAPDIAEKVSTLLAEHADTPSETQLARAVGSVSKQSRADSDFRQHLENARVYQRFQLYGQADREYLQALERIPPGFEPERRKIDDAKSAYAADRFFDAARLFEDAFRGISIQ